MRNGPRRPAQLLVFVAMLAMLALVACSSDNKETASGPEDRGYANPGRLVTTAWLQDHLDDSSVRIIDLRGEDDYARGHIPGAVRVTPNTAFQAEDANGVPGMLPPADHVAGVMSDLGVEPDDTVVFYDGLKNLWSSRGLWALDVYGHKDTRLLDGGWTLWSARNLPISTDTPAVKATDYRFSGAPDTSIIANWEEVLTSVDDPAKIVCDARSPEEYSGRDVRADRGGHIPQSSNVNWVRASNDSGEFKTAAELREIYEGAGVTGDKVVFTLCQTAVRATHTWFVLKELLGYDTVKVYDGSWAEWGNRPDLPIETRS